jgi:4-azaleucine resistance transporter AzlC
VFSLSPHFRQGLKDGIPSVVGMIPFALIVGTASSAAGLDPWLALAMSLLLYAGASQLAAIGLLAQSAPMLIVVATVLVVNLRFVMYSAALAPYFRRFSIRKKWLFAFCITDHLFALVTTKFKPDDKAKDISDYYTAVSMMTWVVWNSMVAIGIFAGTLVPKNYSLDFAIPLVFLALVLPALNSKAHWLTAIVAAIAAFFTAALPMKLGLIAAALVGVIVGTVMDASRERATSS